MKFLSDDALNKIADSMEPLNQKGISRRDFMKFCTAMAAMLSLPASFVPKIAEALGGKKPYLVWLEFQDCAADTEALLRATNLAVGNIVFDIFSVEYHETIMAAAGHQAGKSLMDVIENQKATCRRRKLWKSFLKLLMLIGEA